MVSLLSVNETKRVQKAGAERVPECTHITYWNLIGEAVGWGCSADGAGNVDKGRVIHGVL